MKRFAAIFVLLLSATGAFAAHTLSDSKTYIETYSSVAKAEMSRTGVPASITLAQGLLESGAGQSDLATVAFNHFGIKCHRWTGRSFYKDDDKANECFRAYDSVEESFRDHSDFLRYQDRYKALFELDPTDYEGWARGLKAAGYATDPSYPDKLIKLIEDFELYKFDVDEEVVVPETPAEIERPKIVEPESIPTVKVSEEYQYRLARPVYKQNGVECVYAAQGETYESIALAHNLFRREILRFNDLAKDEALSEGDIVYLAPKKRQAASGIDKYIVGSDSETLRSIAQRFGIKEASIRKINGFPLDYQPSEGDTILLRKAK